MNTKIPTDKEIRKALKPVIEAGRTSKEKVANMMKIVAAAGKTSAVTFKLLDQTVKDATKAMRSMPKLPPLNRPMLGSQATIQRLLRQWVPAGTVVETVNYEDESVGFFVSSDGSMGTTLHKENARLKEEIASLKKQLIAAGFAPLLEQELFD